MPVSLEWSTTATLGSPRSRSRLLSLSDPTAPTILTSRPEGKVAGEPAKEENHGPPHGHCGLCRYKTFCRLEDGPGHCTNLEDPIRTGKRRTAVSAEAIGNWASEPAEGIQAFCKCKDTRRFLLKALVNAGPPLKEWFQDMDEDFLEQVVASGRGWRASGGDEIILQGEQLGDMAPGLYVLESGELHVFKQHAGETSPGKLTKKYERRGDTLGELAVLYGAPRAATVVAAKDSYLWSIDRHTMTYLKRQCMEARRVRYHELLQRVELLAPLGCAERAQVIDSLVPAFFKKGEVIIEQGAEGTEFYLLEDGSATAFKDGDIVASYGPGSCFGELALLNNQPRAASVIAAADCKCACLGRQSFDRLLGPLESLRTLAGIPPPGAHWPTSSSAQGAQAAPVSEAPSPDPSLSHRSSSRAACAEVCDRSPEEQPPRTPGSGARQSRRSGGSRVHQDECEEEPPRTPGSGARQSRRQGSGVVCQDEGEEEQPLRTPGSGARHSRRSGGSASHQDEGVEEQPLRTPGFGAGHSRRSGGSAVHQNEEVEDHPPLIAPAGSQSRRSRPSVMMSTELEEEDKLVQDSSPGRRSQVSDHRGSLAVNNPPAGAGDHCPPASQSEQQQQPVGASVRSRTPPPLDYHMPAEDRLCYDSEDDRDDVGLVPQDDVGLVQRDDSPLRREVSPIRPDDRPIQQGSLDRQEARPARPVRPRSIDCRDDSPIQQGGLDLQDDSPSRRNAPKAFESPSRSLLSGPAAAMKAIMRMSRKSSSSSSKEEAPLLTDSAAPNAL